MSEPQRNQGASPYGRRKTDQAQESQGAIRLQVLHVLMFAAAGFIGILLLGAITHTLHSYRLMRESTEAYISNQKSAAMLGDGSDYLTQQVRCFVATGDPAYAQRYFEEAEVEKRRDRAVEDLEKGLGGTQAEGYIREAMRLSNELMEQEYDAMRLVILSRGYDPKDYPEILREADPSIKALSPSQQQERAEELVFGESYAEKKKRIAENVENCMSDLVNETRQRQLEMSDEVERLLRRQIMLTVLMLALTAAVVTATSFFIIRPIEKSVRYIGHQQLIPEMGAGELRFLIRTYNSIFEKNRVSQIRLSYEATHDPLTGVFNRGAYEKALEENEERSCALLLVDVDAFKSVNDTYGHETGDRVLQRVADTLRRHFREGDYICRIGGDEFAVIMVYVGHELTELVRSKIGTVMEELGAAAEDSPAVTLSVGAAFSDELRPGHSLYKDADRALYTAKDNGRNGICFYREIGDENA